MGTSNSAEARTPDEESISGNDTTGNPSPDQRDNSEANIWVAAGDGNLERVRRLIAQDGSLVNAKDDFGYTPLAASSSWGRLEVAQLLISSGAEVNSIDESGDTALHRASTLAVLQFLLESGADTKLVNEDGFNPLQQHEADLEDIV